jgi:hypothetical protein
MARDDRDIDRLARAHYAVLSPQNLVLFESIERRIARNQVVEMREYEQILLAIFSSSYGDCHKALALEEGGEECCA